MDDIFHFEWQVDQSGYEIVSAEDDPPAIERPAFEEDPPIGGNWYIKRKGGPLRAYRPRESAPGLARQFASLPRQPQALLDFANNFGLLGVVDAEHPGEAGLWWYDNIFEMGLVVRDIDSGNKRAMASAFTKYVAPRMTVRIEVPPKGHPALKVAPLDLISAMWLQIAGEITNETKFRKCLWCPTWFSYGPGTGRKDTKRFCSDRCRKGWNRQQNSGVKH